MPLLLLFIGVALLTTVFRGDKTFLWATLKDDIGGGSGFFYFVIAFALVAGLGFFKPLRGFSNAFLVLLFVVLILRTNTGLLDQLKTGFNDAVNGQTTVYQLR